MAKRWSFSLGEYGASVRVYERGNAMYIAYQKDGESVRKTLGPVSQAEARQQTYAVHETLLERAEAVVLTGEYTLGRLLSAYRRDMTQHKADRYTRATELRAMSRFKTYFGLGLAPSKIGETEAMRLHRLRMSGEVDANGERVPEGQRVPVSASTATTDLNTLRRILKWGVRNEYIQRNRLDGISFPMNPDPARPVMTPARYKALRKVAPRVRSHFGSHQKWKDGESYFGVVLDLTWHTGRRIDSVLHLRKDEYHPDQGPNGALFFRADADKMKRSGLVPLNAEAQRAIESQLARELAPSEWLFPAPMKPETPVSRATARGWLTRAEDLAELDHVPNGGYHMARRGFVTVRKGLPAADLAALGGWKNQNVMCRIYQQADFETMIQVVQNPISDEE